MKVAFVPVLRPLFWGSRLGLAEGMARVLAELQGILHYQLLVTEEVSSQEGAQEVVRRLTSFSPDLLVVGVITFTGGEVLGPLTEMSLPKVLWAIPEVWHGGPLPQNALCGLNLALSLPSTAAPVKWWFGPPELQAVQLHLDLTLRALRGLQVLRESRLLWLGGPAPGFDAFSEHLWTGARVEFAPLDRLFDIFNNLTPQEVENEVGQGSLWKLVPTESAEKLVRLQIALRKLAEGYSGIALRDWPEIPDRLGIFPAVVISHLSDQGITVAPEGDILGLLSQLVLQAVSGQRAILLDIVAPGPEGLLLWHAGEAPTSWSQGDWTLAPHFNRGLPAVLSLTLREGHVTGLRLFRGRAVLVDGELNGRGGYLGCSGWLSKISWNGVPKDPKSFLECWLNARVPHHIALVHGSFYEEVREALAWARIPLEGGGGEGVWGAFWQ